MGFVQNMTDADISQLLTEAYKFAQSGKESSMVGGAAFSVEERRISPSSYPDTAATATIHTNGAYLKKQPGRDAAKNKGDYLAVKDVVDAVVKKKTFEDIASRIPAGSKVVVVPVLHREGEAMNMLPVAYAERLEEELKSRGINVDIWQETVKTSGNHNTNASAKDRNFNVQIFEGDASSADTHVIIVDDVFTSGNTVQWLKKNRPAEIAGGKDKTRIKEAIARCAGMEGYLGR